MHVSNQTKRLKVSGGVIRQVWVSLVTVCLFSGLGLAQIDVNETGLHDGEIVYGLNVPVTPIPYMNWDDITLRARGETDPNRYAYVTFYAYGLHSDFYLTQNAGAIRVDAAGGMAHATGDASASIPAIQGLYGDGGVDNQGDINVYALAGDAESSEGNASASVTEAYGLNARTDADNTGNITIVASAGTVKAHGVARALVDVTGLRGGGNVNNVGDIDVSGSGGTAKTTQGGASATVTATGLDAGGGASNAGNIRVSATAGLLSGSGDALAQAIGLDANDGVTNTGDIRVRAMGGMGPVGGGAGYATALATGIHSYEGASNTGDIDVAAVAGTAHADVYPSFAYAYSEGSGLFISGDVNNSGAVNVMCVAGTATAIGTPGAAEAVTNAHGMRVYAGDLVNTGAVRVNGAGGIARGENGFTRAKTYGIFVEGYLDNGATIDVNSVGGTATADAYRAEAYSDAYGLYALDDIHNVGDITVLSAGGSATVDNGEANADALAFALCGRSGVYNEGTLSVVATGGAANGSETNAHADARAYGIQARGGVVNTGAIDVTAIAGTAQGADAHSYAYGIYMDDSGNLTNTGVVRADADTTYEVYVASGATTLVDSYNVTLDGDPNAAAFYVRDGATLALNDAQLTVTGVTGETRWDTEYQLFEINETGVVDGNFADVEAIHPDTVASYHTQGTSAAVDDTVSLAYRPRASEPAGATAVQKQLVSQSIDRVNSRMTGTLLQGILSPGTSGLLADAGPVSQNLGLAQSGTAGASGVFVEPYYSRMEHDANPLGYDADLWGFAAGYERQMDETLVSFHAGYGQADVGYTGAGYSANSEDQDLLTAGFSGLTRWSEWTLRYGLTGFYGWHDYQGRTGLNLAETETGETDSYGVVASAMVGRILRKDSHVFLPEAGLTYLWGHRQRYTTDASNAAWDTTYSAMDDHDLQAVAALHWLCGFMHDDIHVTPSASIGVRHLLTDAESTVTQSVPGAAPVSVKSERDRTAMTLSGSVVLRQRRHSLSLAYDGEYSPDTERHSLWLRYGWQF